MMGFASGHVCKCHTCKRRHATGGCKKGGSWAEAKRKGWVFLVKSTLGDMIWLCPTCRRKYAATRLPLG